MKNSIKNILTGSGLGLLVGTIVLGFFYALGLGGIMSGWFSGVSFAFIFFYFALIKDDKDDKN